MFYITDPDLHEQLCREHCQQISQQIAINRMVAATRQHSRLQWLAHLMIKMGEMLQKRVVREHNAMQNISMQNYPIRDVKRDVKRNVNRSALMFWSR